MGENISAPAAALRTGMAAQLRAAEAMAPRPFRARDPSSRRARSDGVAVVGCRLDHWPNRTVPSEHRSAYVEFGCDFLFNKPAH